MRTTYFLHFKFEMSGEDIYDISEDKNELSLSSLYISEVGNIHIYFRNFSYMS